MFSSFVRRLKEKHYIHTWEAKQILGYSLRCCGKCGRLQLLVRDDFLGYGWFETNEGEYFNNLWYHSKYNFEYWGTKDWMEYQKAQLNK